VIGSQHAVARADTGSLHDRQNVALHSFAADIGAVSGFAAGDFVDFIEENYAALFDTIEGEPGDLLHIHQFLLFFLNDVVGGLGDRHPALPPLAFHHAGKKILHVELDFLEAGAFEKLERHRAHRMLADLQFDDALVEFARAQLLAEFLAYLLDAGEIVAAACAAPFARNIFNGGQQQIEQPLLRVLFGLLLDLVDLFGANHVHRNFNEIAYHRFDIAPDIAHFREFGCLDFQKGRIGEPREPSGDFRFPDARWPDHDDVFGRNLLGHFLVQLLPADAVAQGDRHGLFRRLLPDNIPVQLLDNFAGGHFIQTTLVLIATH